MSKPELNKSIADGIAAMMNSLAADKLPELKSSELSDIQNQIVHSRSNNIAVVAGAGSGKTRVLTERIKWLLEEGADPSNLVAITFTNMAADEMRERLAGVKGIGDAFIGTIHAFANKIFANSGSSYEIFTEAKDNEFRAYLIDKYCSALTMKKMLQFKDMQILMEQGKITEEALNSFLLPSEQYEVSMMEGIDVSCKMTEKELRSMKYTQFPENIKTLMKKYNVITFDQLLEEATNYYESLDAEIEHVLVDEFQDIGRLEHRFIIGLNAVNTFFVGDDWQSIYGFKGANSNIFKGVVRNTKDNAVFYLTDNYRSHSEILDFAGSIIDQVDDKIDKDVVSHKGQGGSVTVDTKFNISKYLNDIKSKGDYKDWFLLVRNNKELNQLCDKLGFLGIPYSSFKKGNLTLNELRLEMKADTIKVLTVHTAKGLESKNVILYGNFPTKQPPYLKNSEERRVMYVGCTRAEENLIVLN